ncbi:MAG: hypothetical protein RRZ66_09890, partial [Bacteroidales bacterium]
PYFLPVLNGFGGLNNVYYIFLRKDLALGLSCSRRAGFFLFVLKRKFCKINFIVILNVYLSGIFKASRYFFNSIPYTNTT